MAVIVESVAPNGSRFYTLYGHLGPGSLPESGTPVVAGETVLGVVGTEKYVNSFPHANIKGTHLHLEIIDGNLNINKTDGLGIVSSDLTYRADPETFDINDPKFPYEVTGRPPKPGDGQNGSPKPSSPSVPQLSTAPKNLLQPNPQSTPQKPPAEPPLNLVPPQFRSLPPVPSGGSSPLPLFDGSPLYFGPQSPPLRAGPFTPPTPYNPGSGPGGNGFDPAGSNGIGNSASGNSVGSGIGNSYNSGGSGSVGSGISGGMSGGNGDNWASSPAGIAPLSAPSRPDSFATRFGDWGATPAGDSGEPLSPLLRELEKIRRSAAPDGAAPPSLQDVAPATPAFQPDAVYAPDGNFYGNFPAGSPVATAPSPAAFSVPGPGFGPRSAVDFNTLAQGITRLLSGAGGFIGNSLIPSANAASSSRPPLTPTVSSFPAAASTADQSNPAYWNGRPMADTVGSPLSQASIFDTGAPAAPLGGVFKYFDERMVPTTAQELAGRFADLAAGTDPEPTPDTPTNAAPGFPRLMRMVSSAFAGLRFQGSSRAARSKGIAGSVSRPTYSIPEPC